MTGEESEGLWMHMLQRVADGREREVAEFDKMETMPLTDDAMLEQQSNEEDRALVEKVMRRRKHCSAEEETAAFLERMRQRKVRPSVEVDHTAPRLPILTPQTSISQGDEALPKRPGPPLSSANKRIHGQGGDGFQTSSGGEISNTSDASSQTGLGGTAGSAWQTNMGLVGPYGQGRGMAPASEIPPMQGFGFGPAPGFSSLHGQEWRASGVSPMHAPQHYGWPGMGMGMGMGMGVPGGFHQFPQGYGGGVGPPGFYGGYTGPAVSAQSPILFRSGEDQRSRTVASTPEPGSGHGVETPSRGPSKHALVATPRTTDRRSSRAPSVAISTPKQPTTELAKEMRLPLRLWVPDEGGQTEGGECVDGGWKEEEDMPAELCTFLQQALYSKVCDPAKVSKWNAMRPNEEVCVLTCCVTRDNKSTWTGQQALSACKTCTASWKSVRGRKPESRPCGRRMEGKVAILPLPKEERKGKAWKDKGFWVNRAD